LTSVKEADEAFWPDAIENNVGRKLSGLPAGGGEIRNWGRNMMTRTSGALLSTYNALNVRYWTIYSIFTVSISLDWSVSKQAEGVG